MVARITTGKSIRAMLYYNENKVSVREANLILASGFAGDIETMKLESKLKRFQHLNDLKPNVKTNAVHITLNFHSSEKISNEKLQQIALSYMEQIGFGEQPYLVYRHYDAAHTHLHIVSNNITRFAERIELHDIGKLLSEPARRSIEVEFDLIKAESTELRHFPVIRRVEPDKVKYGHLPTKRAISNVLTAVLRDYQFTSLAEYNAALKCFNVMAFRGEEHSEMFAKKGLMYTVIKKGNPVGVPIKASAFYTRPTLRNLEVMFVKKQEKRKPHRDALKHKIDKTLALFYSISPRKFMEEMSKRGIEVNFRKNNNGQTFGVTFVDHGTRCVFNGSDLGKAYSAKGLSERFSNLTRARFPSKSEQGSGTLNNNLLDSETKELSFLEIALAETQPDYGPGLPKRKKKKRKQQQLNR